MAIKETSLAELWDKFLNSINSVERLEKIISRCEEEELRFLKSDLKRRLNELKAENE